MQPYDAQVARATLRTQGRVWLRGAVSSAELEVLRSLLPKAPQPGARLAAGADATDHIRSAGFSTEIARIWEGSRPARVVSFDKTAEANWGVPWHQDRIIQVKERSAVSGYSNWSKKGAAWHCEPPIEILQQMLFVRVHLDASTPENGPMEIALGSHHAGVVPMSDARSIAAGFPTEVLLAEAGDVLVLSMLVLHRSQPAHVATRRSVLRIDYARDNLPFPLRWGL